MAYDADVLTDLLRFIFESRNVRIGAMTQPSSYHLKR